MSHYTYSFSAPDLGFVPAQARLSATQQTRFFIFGQGSLGKSMRTALMQAGFTVTRGYDNDQWERRNLVNTLGLTVDRVGRNKGFNVNLLNTSLGSAQFLRHINATAPSQPVFILSTDNIATRSAIMSLARQKGALVIDMRSSPELTRTICINTRQLDNCLEQDPAAHERFLYLYPPVVRNEEENRFELLEPEQENTGQEGGCMMRGSIMHTLTCISRAMQFVFRQFQPNYNQTFEIIEDHPWTGVSTQQSFGDEQARDLLLDHASSYQPFDPIHYREHTIVTATERPPWTGDVPARSNAISGMAQAEGQLYYEWTDTSTADTSGSAETATSN